MKIFFEKSEIKFKVLKASAERNIKCQLGEEVVGVCVLILIGKREIEKFFSFVFRDSEHTKGYHQVIRSD